MSDAPIRISPELLPIIALGVLELDAVRNREDDARLNGPLAEAENAVRVRPPAERAAVRAMYWKVGIDPTKRRPSSEALLRRVVRGDGLPRINSLVDVCNWCSLEFQLPYGLYDRDRIEGAVVLRTGRPGEEYAGIRKDRVHVEGRLTLADAIGPFGNPTSDSARTMVTTATTRALAIVFAPRDVGEEAVARALEATFERAVAFTGARETSRVVL